MLLRRTAPCVAVTAAAAALLCAAPATALTPASVTAPAVSTATITAPAVAEPLAPAPAGPVTVAVVASKSGSAEPTPPATTPDSGTEWIIGAGALTLAVGAGMIALARHRPDRRG